MSGKTVFTEISPSEFFYRNRDLAGFSNPSRALYSAIREIVENSLDSCELHSILPELYVRVSYAPGEEDKQEPKRYELVAIDNGSGIEKEQIPRAFGRIFYGSKYKLRQARGMFGMGGTMSVLYAQITTSKPVEITSCADGETYHRYLMLIDIEKNVPSIIKREEGGSNGWRGTKVKLQLVGDYFRSAAKIADYFRNTALVTPYANIAFVDPNGRLLHFRRGTDEMPEPPKETLPHPHGIDVEAVKRLIRNWKGGPVSKFMTQTFHRVGGKTALDFLAYASVPPGQDPTRFGNDELVRFTEALHGYDKFLPPDGRCLSPLDEQIFTAGIVKELSPEFYSVVVREPAAYSGFPFIVEVGLAYGGKSNQPGMKLLRFANRIPLLYDEGSDVSFKVLTEEIDLRRYKVPQEAPLVMITHICSTKVPYKTVGKEYIADRPEIEKELRNAMREALRKLQVYLSKKGSMEKQRKKMNIYSKYMPMIARFSANLIGTDKLPDYNKLIGLDIFSEGESDEAS
ncbi:MAG: DNA topoisomerase VI subunit B [Nitrososphaerota archaeon]|nr:DNA topoisomerase VI subunit B [Nitrososphaerota archaeon]MDG6939991.1 DNA topoisomerase VI subunit B [Nitrososphaerota archaeon]